MVGVTKIQRANARYWLNAVAKGGEDYYTKPGEAPGEWIGELADELGLSGQVDAEGYTAVLDGVDPTSGNQLVRRPETRYRQRPDGSEKAVEPVLGYDVRFACPKSVSILYALGDERTRERVLAVVNDAVREGLAHLEHEACFVQRGKGGQRIERGEGFIGMAFRHRMSRAGDPALHVHVVVSNLTRAASDGKWLSLASPRGRSPLWPHGKSAGVVFQAALRAGFRREFGLGFDGVKNGYADLRGFSRKVIDALSTRRKEIIQWLDQNGADGPSAAQIAAYKTRDKKDYGVSEDGRRAEWIEAAAPYGITPERIAEMVGDARPAEPRQIASADIEAALSALEGSASHFDRRELLWSLCDQLPEGAELDSLSAAVDQVLGSDRILCIHRSEDPLGFDRYTTPRIAEVERRFLDSAIEGAADGACQADAATISAVLDRHDYLGADQRQMVERLTADGERIVPVAAWPGTGKTTALEAAREIWADAGFTVIGCATARSASAEMRAAGITEATSIAELLHLTTRRRVEGKTPLPAGTVIVVDEASVTSTPELDGLRFLAVECDGKLVAIGDPAQIGAIGPGGLYGQLTRTVEPATLTTIRRQKRPADQRVVRLAHEGRGSEALDLLRIEDRVIVGDDLQTTLDAMVCDWHRDYATGADAVMIARRNRDVDYLNERARELRRETGALGEAEVTVGERAFAAGDRVQTRINREGVINRERWDVVAVNSQKRTISLRRVGGEERVVELGPKYLDRRRPDGGPALEHSYAITKFGAQGKTVDRAYPLLDAGSSAEQELVALSRGREMAKVYAVAASELTDADLGPGRRGVSDPLQDIRQAIEREGNEFSAAEFATRESINALTPTELARRRAELAALGRSADPLLGEIDRLDRIIKRESEWVGPLARERAAIEAIQPPPAEELKRVKVAQKRLAERLRRARAERAALPAPDPGVAPRPREPAERLEAVLIDQRISQLVSRRVNADRPEPSALTYETFGAYPFEDPAKGLAWQEGVRAMHGYRHRFGVRGESSPLGERPRSAAARSEYAKAKRQIRAAQRTLGRGADRGAERSAGIERAITRSTRQ